MRTGPVSLRVGFASDDAFGYAADLGLPQPSPRAQRSLFDQDPEFKVEAIWSGPVLRPGSLLAERHGPLVRTRGGDDAWLELSRSLAAYESMVSEIADPSRAPELLAVRERMRAWRFYDRVRTDAEAPARGAQIGTRTTVLDDEGADLAAALQTIREIGDAAGMDAAVADAFPGSRVEIEVVSDGRLEVTLHQPGMLRPLRAAELSEGHAALLDLGRGPAQSAAGGADGAQRTGDQPAPGPAAGPGATPRGCRSAFADVGGHALTGAR